MRGKLFSFIFLKCIFIYLAVPRLGCSMQTLSCGMWNLVPRLGIEPVPMHWEHGVLAMGPSGKSLRGKYSEEVLKICPFLEQGQALP